MLLSRVVIMINHICETVFQQNFEALMVINDIDIFGLFDSQRHSVKHDPEKWCYSIYDQFPLVRKF